MEEFGKSKEAWFRTFIELPEGIPRHDTFNRVFQALDPQAFFNCFMSWTESLRTAYLPKNSLLTLLFWLFCAITM